MISALVNRPALGNFPSSRWHDILQDGLLKVAPEGLNNVFTAQSGSEANELAYKAAFMLYRRKERDGGDWTSEEVSSCINTFGYGSLLLLAVVHRLIDYSLPVALQKITWKGMQ